MLIYDVIVYGSAVLGSVISMWLLYDVRREYRKDQPPAVKVHPELLAQMRSEVIHDAVKGKLRSGYQRSNYK